MARTTWEYINHHTSHVSIVSNGLSPSTFIYLSCNVLFQSSGHSHVSNAYFRSIRLIPLEHSINWLSCLVPPVNQKVLCMRDASSCPSLGCTLLTPADRTKYLSRSPARVPGKFSASGIRILLTFQLAEFQQLLSADICSLEADFNIHLPRDGEVAHVCCHQAAGSRRCYP